MNYELRMGEQEKHKEKQAGLTLVEILVAVALFSMLMLYLASFQRDLFSQNAFMQKSIISEQQARSSLKKLIGSLRSMSSASDGSYPIALATDQALTYFSDIDADGLKEKNRYFMTGNSLMRGIIKPAGSPLSYSGTETITLEAQNISTSTPIFLYYDENYDGISSTTAMTSPINIPLIRGIGINLVIRFDSVHAPVTFSSQVTLRNLKN